MYQLHELVLQLSEDLGHPAPALDVLALAVVLRVRLSDHALSPAHAELFGPYHGGCSDEHVSALTSVQRLRVMAIAATTFKAILSACADGKFGDYRVTIGWETQTRHSSPLTIFVSPHLAQRVVRKRYFLVVQEVRAYVRASLRVTLFEVFLFCKFHLQKRQLLPSDKLRTQTTGLLCCDSTNHDSSLGLCGEAKKVREP